jgi:hypothetical protein
MDFPPFMMVYHKQQDCPIPVEPRQFKMMMRWLTGASSFKSL